MEADQLEGMVGNADFDVIKTINQQFPTGSELLIPAAAYSLARRGVSFWTGWVPETIKRQDQ